MFKMIVRASAIVGLALGASFVSPVERVAASSADRNCGGVNEKTCITLNRNNRCDAGLVEQSQPGRNICVRPGGGTPRGENCGGEGQNTCINLNRNRRCDAGLVEQSQSGRNICVKPEDQTARQDNCGGEGENTCINLNRNRRCDAGLVEQSQSGRNICVQPEDRTTRSDNCGGEGQKTCISLNRARRCDAGLVEQSQRGRNICVVPGEGASRGDRCGGEGEKACIHINPNRRCEAGLVEQRQAGRNICVQRTSEGDLTGGCGGLNQNTCISPNPARWCDAGFTVLRQAGRNTCIPEEDRRPGSLNCGGFEQERCQSINPARWCNDGFENKVVFGRPDICMPEISNADRLDATREILTEIGDENALLALTECLNGPGTIGRIQTTINNRISADLWGLLLECGAELEPLQALGMLAAMNGGVEGDDDQIFNTLNITVGVNGATGVAGAAGVGVAIELRPDGNARWFVTGGVGLGPKAEVVGDITVGLSRSEIPEGLFGFDSGLAGVVSGHVKVGVSGGVEFQSSSIIPNGLTFGVGGGLGGGGAVYASGSLFPFPNF